MGSSTLLSSTLRHPPRVWGLAYSRSPANNFISDVAITDYDTGSHVPCYVGYDRSRATDKVAGGDGHRWWVLLTAPDPL